MNPLFLLIPLLVFLAFPLEVQANPDREALRHLPIQDAHEGRIKPFDTFARETLQLIYGRETFKKTLLKKSPEGVEIRERVHLEAVDIVMMWILWSEEWKTQEILQIRHSGLREALGLEGEKKVHFAPESLMQNEKWPLILQELHSKRESGEKLNPYFQAVQTLQNQLGVFIGIAHGQIPRVLPRQEDDNWLSLSELEGEDGKTFYAVVDSFISYAATHIAQVKKTKETYKEGNLKQAIESFQTRAQTKFPLKYGRKDLLDTEVHYEKLQPFMWAWLLYLLSGYPSWSLPSESQSP